MDRLDESERLRRALLEQFHRESRRDLLVCARELMAPWVLLAHYGSSRSYRPSSRAPYCNYSKAALSAIHGGNLLVALSPRCRIVVL
jgi:hypothetical protein